MRKWLQKAVFVSISMCALALVPAVRAIDEDYADRMLFADGLFARQMYDLAMREYTAILRTFPDGTQNDAATFRLAESLRLHGDAEAAGRFYARVVANFRDSSYRLRAAYRRARLYADAGELESAQAHFEAILGAEPEPGLGIATRYYLGEVLYRLGHLAEADASMHLLLEAHPDSEFVVFALLKRAEIRRSQLAQAQEATGALDEGLIAEALVFYQQALAAADSDRLVAEVLFQTADIHFRQAAFEEAAGYYRRLMRAFPDDPRAREARLQAAWSALRSNLYAEALAVAEAALADDPDDAMTDEWLYVRANSERQLLQSEKSAATYADLLLRFPGSRFADAARYEMSVAYYRSGNFEAAIREAERIRVTAQTRKDVSWLLAESYAALQRSAEAVQHYRMVVRETGASERTRDALYRLAHHLQQQGAYREASAFYLQLVDAFGEDPVAPQALFASGYALAQAHAHEEAVRDWRRLGQQYPEHALAEEAWYQKAVGEIRLQRRADALSSLAELLRRYPESRYRADGLYWQGVLHFEADQFAEAEPPLRQVLKLAPRDTLQRDAQFRLGLVLQRLDKLDESAGLLHDLVESPLRGAFSAPLLEWLASHHGSKGAFDRMAQVAALLAAQAEPAWQQSGNVLLARALLAQDDQAGAERVLRAALALNVQTVYAGEAALQLGLLLLARAELDEAQLMLRRVSELAAGGQADAVRARSLIALGKVAVAREHPADAARLFLSVGILYDDPALVPESLYLAAVSFAAQGRETEQAKVVAEMLERYPESDWTLKARQKWAL